MVGINIGPVRSHSSDEPVLSVPRLVQVHLDVWSQKQPPSFSQGRKGSRKHQSSCWVFALSLLYSQSLLTACKIILGRNKEHIQFAEIKFEPRTSQLPGKCSTPDLHPEPFLNFILRQALAKMPRLTFKFSCFGLSSSWDSKWVPVCQAFSISYRGKKTPSQQEKKWHK